MKRLILFLALFLFPLYAQALDIESQLTDMEKGILELNDSVNNYENSLLDKTYPIGSIFETTSYSTVSQVENIFGGKWQVYGSGRILVGINSGDSNFNTVDKTGGNASITLSTANLPSHAHSVPVLTISTSAAGAHTHTVFAYNDQSGYGYTIPAGAHYFKFAGLSYSGASTIANKNRLAGIKALSAGAHKHSVTTTANTAEATGDGYKFTNLQPSIAVYRYRRVS